MSILVLRVSCCASTLARIVLVSCLSFVNLAQLLFISCFRSFCLFSSRFLKDPTSLSRLSLTVDVLFKQLVFAAIIEFSSSSFKRLILVLFRPISYFIGESFSLSFSSQILFSLFLISDFKFEKFYPEFGVVHS